MKNSPTELKSHFLFAIQRQIVFWSVVALLASSLQAENVFITGWKGTSTTGATDKTPCNPSCVVGFATIGASGASASQVSPVPLIPNNARRIHYGNSTSAQWDLTPTDIVLTPIAPAGTGPYTNTTLQHLGVYKIYLTKGQTNNSSDDIIVRLTAAENSLPAQLADTNGIAASEIFLDIYQKLNTNAFHNWFHVGYITNTTLSPTITIKWFSGLIDDNDGAHNNAKRWYTDAIRFEYLDSCVGVANEVGINGPLSQGQTNVNVTGVAANATNVTVYANNSPIGQTNLAPGFIGGNLSVITTNLIKGQKITAGQIKNGCSSSVPTTGPTVGSGSNGSLKAFLSCLQIPELTGPAGANTTNSPGTNYFLKAAGFTSGFGTAPTGGATLATDGCWHTVTFNHQTDDTLAANGSSTAKNTDPFCALDGLLFSIVDDETGPYDIYVDQIMNGDVMIENFEGQASGATRLFAAPNQAAAPNPVSTYLGAPNSSLISQNNVFDGTNACRIQWQWSDPSNIRWARVPANLTASSKFNPQLNTTNPITIRYLVLPAGQNTNNLFFPTVPVSQTKSAGESVLFTVSATGGSPFTYQWQKDSVDIASANNSSYMRNNLVDADAGTYSVIVTGGGCNITNSATLTIAAVPPSITYSRSGNTIDLVWSDASFTLQQATALTNSALDWSDVIGATSPYNVNTSTGTKYFRLIKH